MAKQKKIVGSKKLSDYKEGCDCTVCECKDKKGNVVKVYFCPKCKSEKVGYVFGLKNLLGIIPKMECKICCYHAPVFPQWVIEQEELKRRGVSPTGQNRANAKIKNNSNVRKNK